MRYISARMVYPVTKPAIPQGVLAVADDGTIRAVMTKDEAEREGISAIEYFDGLLVPGFVNTHCHLELSHMRDKIKGGAGLVSFVTDVIKTRGAEAGDINHEMLKADEEMYEAGIVAVGDISNQVVSKPVKEKSKIYYHTFIELMGFNPAGADAIMDRGLALKKEFEPGKAGLVPHAPYSVSGVLMERIAEEERRFKGPISIHNQETEEENLFFMEKKGRFLDLYTFLNQDISFYEAAGKTSLQSYLSLLPADNNVLLVHNTFSSKEDVAFAEDLHPNLYWCLCPKANLYIERVLPDVEMLMKAGLKITLGTDGLSSNDSLSILEEMGTLQEHKGVPFQELLKWATYNGACFLGIEDRFGSFEVGKQPGFVLITGAEEDKLVAGSKSRRLSFDEKSIG